MKIEVLHYNEGYIRLICSAGKNCYGLREKVSFLNPSEMKKFVSKVLELGHESLLEHICVTFLITDVSRSFMSQLTRHRFVSFSIKSQHFVPYVNFRFKELEFFGRGREGKKSEVEFLALMSDINKAYLRFIQRGVPHYVAREMLPNACLTDIVMTTNARELRHIIKLRGGEENVPEFREFIRELLEVCVSYMPELFVGLKKYLGGKNEWEK